MPLLSTASYATAAPDIWTVNLPYGPAPPPDKAPPISRGAIRDPSLLKYVVIAIACAYVGFVLVIATLLFTVGKRLRRAAQSSHGTLSMEMVKPNRWMADISPAVQSSKFGQKWGSIKSGNSSLKTTPVTASEPHFDSNILESDKLRREREMERIYEVVMDQDTKAPKEVADSIKESDTSSVRHTRNPSSSSRSFSQRVPPQMAHSPATSTVYSQQTGYAPNYSLPSPTSPRSIHGHSRQPSNASMRSQQTATTAAQGPAPPNGRAKHTRTVKNLTISAPMQKYPSADDDHEARTPLSPRHQNPGQGSAAPHEPPHRPITPIVDDEETEDSEEMYEGVDPRRPLPSAAPQRNVPTSPHRTISATKKPVPPPLPPPPRDPPPAAMATTSAGSSSNSLPFRKDSSVANAYTGNSPMSPGPTKTTLLSPKRDRFPKQNAAHPLGFVGITSPGAGGARSAGLSPTTPYSPYMPFTPATPITPRLTTRAERKQRQREGGRRVANAEEDAVKDEREMWGDGWS